MGGDYRRRTRLAPGPSPAWIERERGLVSSEVRVPNPRRVSPDAPAETTRVKTDEEAVMAETWSGEFYCVKCKEKREADGEVRVNDKGTRMAKAVCPVCGTNLNRILGKA